MTWSVKELVAWLGEVEPNADQRGKFDWLEIPPTASSTAIQEAYHQVARSRHPDLFRNLDPKLMDRLVRMYGRVTAAYADLKEPEKCAAYLRELRGPRPQTVQPSNAPQAGRMAPRLNVAAGSGRSESSSHRADTSPPAHGESPHPPGRATSITTPPPMGAPAPGERATAPVPRPQRDGPIDPASTMNARALAFYRRAEGAQRTGDKAAALLQIKMAIAADPKSTFLRAALAELTKH